MKYSGNWHWLLYCLFAIGFSCRKYNDPWGCSDCPMVDGKCDCENYPKIKDTNTGISFYVLGGESYKTNTYNIYNPQINPANSNQIAFTELFYKEQYAADDTLWRFVLYDIVGNTKTFLSSIIGFELGMVHYCWDHKNNIYLNYNEGGKGYMARINTISGSQELKELPDVEFTSGMTWIKSNGKIGFEAYYSNNKRLYYMMDFESGDIDTIADYLDKIYFNYYQVRFSKDMYLNCLRPNGDITYYHVPDGDTGTLAKKWQFNFKMKEHMDYFSYYWHPNKNVLFMANEHSGIHYATVNKHNIVRIKKACDNYRYSDISISEDGQHIYALRTHCEYSKDAKLTNYNGWLYKNDEIVVMDIDGCNEEVVYRGY
ncbi:hypothetical protein GC194_08895 [bacterium]|nr:hypothetical protein [bacterium]